MQAPGSTFKYQNASLASLCYTIINDVKTAPDAGSFEFDSVEPKRTVRKIVRYSEINVHNFYNIGFGANDLQTGFISDLTETNNNDNQKVLATVAAILYAFTDIHPDTIVIATSGTEAKTRLFSATVRKNSFHTLLSYAAGPGK